jgi:predicted transcriptional regulator
MEQILKMLKYSSILELCNGENSVKEIQAQITDFKGLSNILNRLKILGLVTPNRVGKNMYYIANTTKIDTAKQFAADLGMTVEKCRECFIVANNAFSKKIHNFIAKQTQPVNVGTIRTATGFEQAVVSFHLRKMKALGLVSSERKSRMVFYQNTPLLQNFIYINITVTK